MDIRSGGAGIVTSGGRETLIVASRTQGAAEVGCVWSGAAVVTRVSEEVRCRHERSGRVEYGARGSAGNAVGEGCGNRDFLNA